MIWYLSGFFITWFSLALFITIRAYDQDKLAQIIINVSGTCIASLIWPLTIVGLVMVFVIQYIGRKYYGNIN